MRIKCKKYIVVSEQTTWQGEWIKLTKRLRKKKKTDICINGTWNMLPEVSLSLTEVQHYRKPHWELTSKQQRGARPDVLVSSLLGVTVDKDFIL